MKTFIDLFAGIGGFRIALEANRCKCVFSSENDKHARWAYQQNFGDNPTLTGNITQIKSKDIPPHDILCAGFPCQPFSIAGKGKGIDDNQSRLFTDIVRIAKYHQPKILLLENVPNILKIDNGKILNWIIQSLQKIGYEVHYDILNASVFGIPQTRKRVYFVCIRKNSYITYTTPKPTYQPCSINDFLLPNRKCKHLFSDRNHIFWHNNQSVSCLTIPELKPKRIGGFNQQAQADRIYSTEAHARTLIANGGGGGAKTGWYKVGTRIRTLHIDECKAIMGFKKSWIVSDGGHGYQQLGNAVIPKMIQHIYEGLKWG